MQYLRIPMTDGAVETRQGHVPGLDGLRAIAVAAVVAYHLDLLPGGFIGVDLFFVLSGFLITSLLLLRTPSGLAELRSWWGRRIRRLTPAVAAVVVAVLVTFGVDGAATQSLDIDAVATMTWWQNWHLIFADVSYWAPQVSPLRHAWSLSIEEQFYLVWPLFLMGAVWTARRVGRSENGAVLAVAAAGTVASFAWAARLASVGADLSRVYFGTDTRAGALLLGCAAAAVVDGATTPVMGRRGAIAAGASATVLVVLVGVLDPSEPATYLWGLPVAAAASLILVLTAVVLCTRRTSAFARAAAMDRRQVVRDLPVVVAGAGPHRAAVARRRRAGSSSR
ncbi:MAG: acyltransferase [Microthrixaceae bacterium]